MITKIVQAVVVAIVVTLICVLLGMILISINVGVAVAVGNFFRTYGTAIGLLAGLWYAFTGEARPHLP